MARRKCKRRTRRRTSVARRRRRIRGGSKFMNFLRKANKWLRRSKAISKGSKFLAENTSLPYVGKIAKYSKKVGYGRRRRRVRMRRGRGLKLAGSGHYY